MDMASQVSRSRAGTITYSKADAAGLRDHLDELNNACTGCDPPDSPFPPQTELAIRSIRNLLTENGHSSHMKDAFRHLNGFQVLLELIREICCCLSTHNHPDGEVPRSLEILHCALNLLATALQNHWGNRRFFRKRVEGWEALKGIFTELLQDDTEYLENTNSVRERLFGSLLAFALGDETMKELFSKMRAYIDSNLADRNVGEARSEALNRENSRGTLDVSSPMHWEATTEEMYKLLGPEVLVHNPEIISITLELWLLIRGNSTHATDKAYHSMVLLLPSILSHITEVSTHNLVALHKTGILKVLLTISLDLSLGPFHHAELQKSTIALLQLGVTDLNDAHFLYRNAGTSRAVAELLRLALKKPSTPAFIHFDLSLHGFASIELPDLGRSFPPVGSSSGYTLSIWLRVVQFDANSHTTIFGAFDSSQTCFVLVYLEKDTHNMILQTSVTSSKPSVRFKSFRFEHSRWYHVCLVHRRPKSVSSSRASLFVDGEFVEQVKAHYPSSPPSVISNAESQGPHNIGRKHKPVQVFLGTPQDLATRLGHKVVSSQWRLASALLVDDTLSDDLIAVHKELGPRYHGNYQDCLGSFQTYQASAALNLRNESLHPGKEEKSDIVSAIRSKASGLLPESSIILSISPMNIFDEDDRNSLDETQLIKSLSKPAAKNLRNITRGGRTSIAINGAIPAINEALLHMYGFAVLTGDPAVVIPQSLDDAAWRVGGCAPVGLALVETAKTNEDVIRALDILLGSIVNSWRNSEAMERENGFGVLASLLTSKLANAPNSAHTNNIHEDPNDEQGKDELAFQLLTRILHFVGYRSERPEDSVINNPLAYRILLVDIDVWRNSTPKVQELYYGQFTTFATGSKHHCFNVKRLARMRIVKKWLDVLKGEDFFASTFDFFIGAFRSLLGSILSADSLRSLALYITYATHKPKDTTPSLLHPTKSVRRLKSSSNSSRRRPTYSSSSPIFSKNRQEGPKELSRLQIGIKILEMYADLLCQPEATNIKKFARTVTNKWLLHLLSDEESSVVVLTSRILARVLVINGPSYVEKFADKTGGFIVMRYRLQRWWNVKSLWPICFAILFGQDVAALDPKAPFDIYNLLTAFTSNGPAKVVYQGILPVIIAMLENGLRNVARNQEDPESPLAAKSNKIRGTPDDEPNSLQKRTRSISLNDPDNVNESRNVRNTQLESSAKTLQIVTRFLCDVHAKSQSFRDFTVTTSYVQELLFVLFPIIVSSDIVSPETELHSRDSSLTFNGHDVIIRPHSQSAMKAPPIVRTTSVEPPTSPKFSKAQPLKRGSSYILVTSEQSKHQPSPARLHPAISPKTELSAPSNISSSIVEEVLEIIIAVFSDQILTRKDFPGTGLFMKVPPGFQEHQAYFESFILRNTLSSLESSIQLNQKLLWEPRVLTNLARFATHLGEAVYEGWFIDGAEIVIDFLGKILEYVQRPDILQMKSVRLCSEIITAMRLVVSRIVLLRLSELDETQGGTNSVLFLDKLTYWQTVLFVGEVNQEEFLKLFCYLLYTKLMSTDERTRDAATNLWRILLVQKSYETLGVLGQMIAAEDKHLSRGFQKILELDNANFLEWVDDHREDLDPIFFGRVATVWEDFVSAENRRTEESAKARVSKRRERLKVWHTDDLSKEDIIRRHEISSDHWRANIYASEHLKRQRSAQDQQDGLNFNASSWATMKQQLHRPCGLLYDNAKPKWQLDQTEGRNRMRCRIIPDYNAHSYNYQAKRANSQASKPNQLHLDVRDRTPDRTQSSIVESPIINGSQSVAKTIQPSEPHSPGIFQHEVADGEDGFEMVEEFRDESESYEDKNRKVMRSLQRGDQVEHVHNISRIVGLEACEGLLILGKNALYLLDNFFQRSDGEIVNVWQAPSEERDSYLQMISGREAGDRTPKPSKLDHETRSWRWEDVLSISKRRFLFRDVAIEVFFVDGRSYLLTIASPQLRDELHQRILAKAQNLPGGLPFGGPEDLWRVESLKAPEDNPQTLGSRFSSVFAHGTSNPATRRWLKGEISNFYYLMLVNTMAGRTFNDLTQYPVFPWVIADYSSEELDLTNPNTFRDLTKPMGCQTPERQAEFRERYQSFAEMGDHNSPPFHYGTHYSSAMIVTSYMIRMQPFVQSYLLLQGGNFDHPDRLFYSIEKAWASASRENMTDVRELIPEFYYLPEFLVNTNEYDFGQRQGDGGTIDDVVLPPWAKGDPNIFIAKNREALESEHVSKHLHHWIDLVFGNKQRGDAALDATNVFHYLSYRGAKNLDEINDPVERLATIGIIHNFGQTPHQVFQRPHQQQEEAKQRIKRLDTLADTLTRLPFPLLESEDSISSLLFSSKHDRLQCSGTFRLNIPPNYDRYMEWGFIDGSVRFYATDTKKLVGLFEHIHQGQLSCAIFVDSRTLVTAGTDCTISVWAVVSTSKSVDLTPKACLFGHKFSITTLTASKSFSTLLSASSDGQVLLWDLNRLDLLREVANGIPVECSRINDVTGRIMICRGPNVTLFTLNGDCLLEQRVCVEGDEVITSCSFYEGTGNEYLVQELIFTGHRRGVVNVWNITLHDGKFILEHVKRLNHMDTAGFNINAAITCILPMSQVVYTGDDDGRVFEWDCIQRNDGR